MEIFGIMLLGAILNGLLASSRGRNTPGWALFGLCFPLISLLVIVLLPDLKATASAEAKIAEAEHQRRLAELRATEQTNSDDTQTCPRCAETVKRAAQACRFCGHEFSTPVSKPR